MYFYPQVNWNHAIIIIISRNRIAGLEKWHTLTSSSGCNLMNEPVINLCIHNIHIHTYYLYICVIHFLLLPYGINFFPINLPSPMTIWDVRLQRWEVIIASVPDPKTDGVVVGYKPTKNLWGYMRGIKGMKGFFRRGREWSSYLGSFVLIFWFPKITSRKLTARPWK